MESSFLGLDLVGRDNSGELLGLRSNISIQEVVYLNFKRRLNKLEYSGIRLTWDILVKEVKQFHDFLKLDIVERSLDNSSDRYSRAR